MKKQKKIQSIPFTKLKKYLPSLIEAEERIDYKAGQIIFYQGHLPTGLCILRKGRVRLFCENSMGEEELQSIVTPPQILGEEAFVGNEVYHYSAKAETDISVSFFSRCVMATGNGGVERAS